MERLLQYAMIFTNAVDARIKNEKDNAIYIEKEIVFDMLKSMNGCKKVVEKYIKPFEKSIESKDQNDMITMDKGDIEELRDFTGNLSLLCNMILNGEEYTQEDKEEAIKDETNE